MENKTKRNRYGMVIDLDRCTGCGACMVACAVENNVPPARPDANERTGITLLRVYRMENGGQFPENRTVYVPVACQQCENTPCVSVCPQKAVELDPETGVVAQIPERCLGCRYCVAACPYHARYFNWYDPQWPQGMGLNPDVSPRMRGVVEKCSFCQGRLHTAKAKAAAAGRREIDPQDYVPACVEACPAGAIAFGDLADPESQVSRQLASGEVFRFLEHVGTESKVYYRSKKAWVRRIAEKFSSREAESRRRA